MTLTADGDSRRTPHGAPARSPEDVRPGPLTLDLAPSTVDVISGLLGRAPVAAPTVAIVGMGYVGLPTALAMVDSGSRIIGLDSNGGRLAAIRDGRVDVVPSDRERLEQAVGRPGFLLTTDPAALALADAVIVCVPTPIDEHLLPDLTALRSACRTVVSHAVHGQTIILTSTSYVGCTRDLLVEGLEQRGFTIGEDIFVAFSPERIDPGRTSHPQETVPRVVGGVTTACTNRALRVIGRIAPTHPVSSAEVAELAKLLENTFRAVNIALANEFETISHEFGLDASEVVAAAATKPFGFMPFKAGIGVGGHCVPCDPHYLLWQLRAHRVSAGVVEQAMAEIAARPGEVVARAAELASDLGRGLRGSRVLVVGAAYKAGVEDTRESPAIEVMAALAERGADVSYHDPLVPMLRLPDGTVLTSLPEPGSHAFDIVIVHVIQPDADTSWLGTNGTLLDPGGRVRDVSRRVRPLAEGR